MTDLDDIGTCIFCHCSVIYREIHEGDTVIKGDVHATTLKTDCYIVAGVATRR